MSRPVAVLLGIAGALVTGITLVVAHWLTFAHITTTESIVAGVVAATGMAMMMVAWQSARGVAIVVELFFLALVVAGYSVLLRATSRSPVKRTMADLRSIATALEARSKDTMDYPRARDINDLAHYLEPTYIRQLPREDGFRNEFRYEAWQIDPHMPGPDHYALASAGHDWLWENNSLRAYAQRLTESSDCDIVYSDGAFIEYPATEGEWQSSKAAASWPSAQQAATDPKAIFDEATALYRSDHFSDAVPLFQKYLDTAPNDALANARIGICLGELNRLQAALPYLMKASALDATDYQSRSNLALIYEKLNRPEEGIDWARQADKIKPNDAAVINNLGWVLLRAGHRDEAIAQFERAVRLAPDEKLYRENLNRARRHDR